MATLPLTVPASAQQPWGQIGGSMGAPAWGKYQHTIGPGNPQTNQMLRPYDPVGSIVRDADIGGTGGTVTSPFVPRDNRLLGRTVF